MSDDDDLGASLRIPVLPRRYKLEPLPHILKVVQGCAKIRLTRREASAVLGVHPDTFRAFLTDYPEAADAWENGEHLGKASLKRLLWRQAKVDPVQARFLAKNTEWLGMDEGKDRIPDPAAVQSVTVNLTLDQRMQRIGQLQQKVLNDGRAAPATPAVVVTATPTAKPGRITQPKPGGAGGL